MFVHLQKYALLISSLLLCALLCVFLLNLSPAFESVEKNYSDSCAVNLSSTTAPAQLSFVLLGNGYVENKKDADFIADTLTSRLKRMHCTNLYNLQKNPYGKVPMVLADSLGVLSDNVAQSKKSVGWAEYLPDTNTLATVFDAMQGDGELTVHVVSNNSKSCGNAVVKVEEHYISPDTVAHKSIVGYAKTDCEGNAIIKGLDRQKGYSVLPIKYGYEYGEAQGVVAGHFDKYKYFGKFCKNEYVYTFEQREHLIQLIDNELLKQMKNDSALTIRTPQEFKTTLIEWFAMVLLAWWALCFVLIATNQ